METVWKSYNVERITGISNFSENLIMILTIKTNENIARWFLEKILNFSSAQFQRIQY